MVYYRIYLFDNCILKKVKLGLHSLLYNNKRWLPANNKIDFLDAAISYCGDIKAYHHMRDFQLVIVKFQDGQRSEIVKVM